MQYIKVNIDIYAYIYTVYIYIYRHTYIYRHRPHSHGMQGTRLVLLVTDAGLHEKNRVYTRPRGFVLATPINEDPSPRRRAKC